MNHDWLDKNTFHYSDFKDLSRLVEEKQKKNRIQRIPQLFCPYAEKYPAENYAGKNEDPPGRKFQTADVNNWKHLASLVFELKTVSQGGSHADEFQAIRTLTLCGPTPWA